MVRVVDFDSLLTLACTEIIRYGADSPQVVRRLLALFDEIELRLPAQQHSVIVGQRHLLTEAVEAALPAPFNAVACVADRRGLG
jgi:uncharacterized membrane protein